MTPNTPNLDWEEQEIDRAFDLANMIFGAALGAYVGVVIAQTKLPIEQVWWLVGALVGLALALYNLRSLAHLMRRTHTGSIRVTITSIIGGIVLCLVAISKSGFRLDVAVALGVGWFGMLIYLLGAHVARRAFRNE